MRFNGWEYIKDKKGFRILPDKEISEPLSFVKYYSLTDYNSDALMNSYLFFSHPLSINDPFDSCHQLVNLGLFSERQLVKLLFKNRNFVISQFELTYKQIETQVSYYIKKDKNELLKMCLTFFWNFIFKDYGILSLAKFDTDMLMWSYYSNHQGFAIKLKKNLFENLVDIIGPFPMNYSNSYETIYPRSVRLEDDKLLYVTNIKSSQWAHENEWRFLVNRNNMSIPNYNDNNLSESKRKVNYDLKNIETIYLGYKFFTGNITKSFLEEDKELYQFNCDKEKKNTDSLKVNILNFVIDNNIELKGIETEDNNTFKLKAVNYKVTVHVRDKEYLVERNKINFN